MLHSPLARAGEIRSGFDSFVRTAVVASRTLKLGEQTIRCEATGGTGAFVITLPNVGEAAGISFSIYAITADGSNTVTVQDQNESEGWSDVVLNSNNQGIVVTSDGIRWLISSGVSIQAAIADHPTPTVYTPHASGAVAVTSNGATDLDTTAAAVDTAIDELTTLSAKVNAILLALEAAGVLES